MNRETSTDISPISVLVVSDAAPSRNGVGAYYQDLIAHLKTRVKHLDIVSPIIVDEKWQAGLVLPLPGDKTQKLCMPNYWKLKKKMASMQPDILVVATPGVYGLCAAHIAHHMRIPFVTGFHTSFEHLTALYWPNSIRGKLVEKYFLYCNQYLFKRTEEVLGNSDSILAQASTMGARSTRLIGTPLAKDFLTPKPNQHKGTLGSLLFAGRLAKEKNLEALIEAAGAHPNLQFSIAGDGPLLEMVTTACTSYENLHYLGWLNRQQLREAIDSHDGLILPSHYETFGTIALEAMARRKMVVVSSGCGISSWPELTEGLIIIQENESITDVLSRIVSLSPEEISTTASKAYDAALNLNTGVINEWIELLKDNIHHFQAQEK